MNCTKDNKISFSAGFSRAFVRRLEKDGVYNNIQKRVNEKFGRDIGYDDVTLTYKQDETYSAKRGIRIKETIYAKKENKSVKLTSSYNRNIMERMIKVLTKNVFISKMRELNGKIECKCPSFKYKNEG